MSFGPFDLRARLARAYIFSGFPLTRTSVPVRTASRIVFRDTVANSTAGIFEGLDLTGRAGLMDRAQSTQFGVGSEGGTAASDATGAHP